MRTAALAASLAESAVSGVMMRILLPAGDGGVTCPVG
jgi:hypothetical protein